MQEHVGQQKFVVGTLGDLVHSLTNPTDDTRQAIARTIGSPAPAEIEERRKSLVDQFTVLAKQAKAESAQPYNHYVSRFDGVGVFQSVLAKLFQDFPDLQGYGDKNVSWVTTPIEEVFHFFKGFFASVYKDIHGEHKSLLQAVVESWNEVKLNLAPYPSGTPQIVTLPDSDVSIALLADWGGDNPAARSVATVVRMAKPDITIHLGDIYYGGTKTECEAFLRLWPMQVDPQNPGKAIPPESSYALNGNHEMYTGGESYFNVVLPAFGQVLPFFCLQNKYWRLIGLDTAYAGGSLRMEGPDGGGISRQWKWLVDLLKTKDGRSNILLTHHQPVSAHHVEYLASEKLRDDIAALIEQEGVTKDAIFGWFFGHEHRAAIYDDTKTDFNARLIGSGCIPHVRQTEKECDPDCTPFLSVNSRGEWGTQSAISMFAQLRFINEYLQINYVDEDNNPWGQEQWNAAKGRLGGMPFTPSGNTYIG